MKPDTQERPDFEKAAEIYANRETGYLPRNSERWLVPYAHFQAGANHGYDLSIKRIEELEAALTEAKEQLGIFSETALSTNIKAGNLYHKLDKLLNHER